jgi:hypothetical protein
VSRRTRPHRGLLARALSVLGLLGLALAPGCQSNGTYLGDRAADLGDIIRGHIMIGEAFAAEVEATRYLSLGFTYESEVWSAGILTRDLGTWHESIQSLGIVFGRHDEMRVVGAPRVSGTYGWNFKGKNAGFQKADPKNPVDWLTLRGTVAVLLGLDLELRVGEAVDFVVGFFTWDPANDDKHK